MENETIRHFFERIAQYTNDASLEINSGAVPYSYIASIGLTVNSAMRYIDDLSHKHSETEVVDRQKQHLLDGLCFGCGQPTWSDENHYCTKTP